ELADELGLKYLETSAKSNINVEDAFLSLARQIMKRMLDSSAQESQGQAGVNLNNSATSMKSKCC
ncbi:MAG: hypothetical protein EOO77_31630, partial [Oxalobacteraceae bacterium]